MVKANSAWEFCTNGYPDADAWASFLRLVIENAKVGMRAYGGITGSAYFDLMCDARNELAAMGRPQPT